MLDSIDMSPVLSPEDYAARRPALERELFDLVRRAKGGGVPVMIVFEGTETAGRGRAIFTLTERLDPRTVVVHPMRSKPRTYERERPWLWRYWMRTPAHGEVVVFDTSWYGRVLDERVRGKVGKREWRAAFEEIEAFERQLADDGVVIAKLFLHVDRPTQRRRAKRLRGESRVESRRARAQNARFGEWLDSVEDVLARTSFAHAPWLVVPANDRRWSRLRVFETVVGELRRTLDARGIPPSPGTPAAAAVATAATVATEGKEVRA